MRHSMEARRSGSDRINNDRDTLKIVYFNSCYDSYIMNHRNHQSNVPWTETECTRSLSVVTNQLKITKLNLVYFWIHLHLSVFNLFYISLFAISTSHSIFIHVSRSLSKLSRKNWLHNDRIVSKWVNFERNWPFYGSVMMKIFEIRSKLVKIDSKKYTDRAGYEWKGIFRIRKHQYPSFYREFWFGKDVI